MNDILRNNIKHSQTLIGPFPKFDPCDFDEALTKEIIKVQLNPQLVYSS
jgi:hypothetical protein